MCPRVCMTESGIGLATYSIRSHSTLGVQNPSKSLVMVDHVERGKATTSPCAIHGRQTVRHAVGAVAIRGWNKQRPFRNEMDRA